VKRIEVTTPSRTYPVIVGSGAFEKLANILPTTAKRIALVTQKRVPVSFASQLHTEFFVVPDGESAKVLATVEDLCRGFARMGLTRNDVVVGVGGGVVTDIAGMAASVYHRGTPVVHVATTLLAQVDAAIGGKCGVNLPEGKNLVGTIWQPHGVICDTDHLATLPAREMASGNGEMAKYHFLIDADLEAMSLEDRVAACVAYKGMVVAGDETESTNRGGKVGRAVLNYGHTLAHALEISGQFDLRHGEAVAIGLCFAARLARELGRIDDESVDYHDQVVASYGLSNALPSSAQPIDLVGLMARDKKALGSLTFVLLGQSGPEVVDGIDSGAVLRAFERMPGFSTSIG